MNLTLAKVATDSARGSFFLISGQLMSTMIMAVAAILVGRFLGPSLYGEYNLVIVIPQLLLLFADLGINAGITKYTASLHAEGKNDRVRQIILSGMVFRMLVGAVVFVASLTMAGVFAILIKRPNTVSLIQLASISIVFQIAFQCSTSAFVGLDKSEYDAMTTNVQATTKTVLSVALVLLGFGVAGAVIGYVAGFIVSSLIAVGILFFGLLRSLKSEAGNSLRQDFAVLMRFGMPLYVSTLVFGFLPLYQQVVLANFATNADVGNYKAATNFLTLLSAITLGISTALLPAFSKLTSTAERARAFFRHANKYTSTLIVPLAVLMMILSNEIVQIVYGASYQSASLFLVMICVPYLLVAVGHVTVSSMFNGFGETRITFRVTIFGAAALIVLSPVLTAIINVPGLIVASLLSSVLSTFYAAYIARRKFRVDFGLRSALKIYGVAMVSSIPVFMMRYLMLPELFVLILGAFLYLFIYLTLIPLVKTFSLSEIQVASTIAAKIPMIRTLVKPILRYEKAITKIADTFS